MWLDELRLGFTARDDDSERLENDPWLCDYNRESFSSNQATGKPFYLDNIIKPQFKISVYVSYWSVLIIDIKKGV